ncbi:DUF6458 family protein [Ornithinimicrobium murale]|uniref:DUF6458 family protein n=1 Tax=Ornithinimicrobium murale TaxID=1050153 RepID=UPI000E0D42C0|nr:DUF6458 family protein [Ornithinimicrobium murale]
MSIAAPVIIAAIGLVLALAVADSFEGVDLVMIGWILFGAGLLWGIVVLATSGRKQSVHRTTATTGHTQQGPGTTEEITEIEGR